MASASAPAPLHHPSDALLRALQEWPLPRAHVSSAERLAWRKCCLAQAVCILHRETLRTLWGWIRYDTALRMTRRLLQCWVHRPGFPRHPARRLLLLRLRLRIGSRAHPPLAPRQTILQWTTAQVYGTPRATDRA